MVLAQLQVVCQSEIGAGRRISESVECRLASSRQAVESENRSKDLTVREQLDKEGREDDVERLEEGVRDGGRPAGGARCLPSPWLACRLSADWKTCQVTLAPPTHPLNNP